MKRRLFLLTILVAPALVFAEERLSSADAFTAGVERLAEIYSPKVGAEPRTFSTTLRVLRTPMKELAGRDVAVAFQAPDRLLLSADVNGGTYTVARDGGEARRRARQAAQRSRVIPEGGGDGAKSQGRQV